MSVKNQEIKSAFDTVMAYLESEKAAAEADDSPLRVARLEDLLEHLTEESVGMED